MCLNWNDFACSNVRANEWKINKTHCILVFLGPIPRRGIVGSHWGCLCVPSFFSPLPEPATSLTLLCSMKRVAAYWKTAYHRKSSPFTDKNESTRNINPSWWGQRGLHSAARATFPSVQPPQQRAGNPGGCFFLALSQVLSCLLCSCLVWMRKTLASDAILALSKTPQSGRKGGDLAKGTHICSVQFSLLRRTALVEQVAALQW